MTTAYEQLTSTFATLDAIEGSLSMLNWDMQTMMPSGGAEARSRQMATLKGLAHQTIADPRVGDWLDAAEADADLGEWERANVVEMRRMWRQRAGLDADLVRAFSETGTRCTMVWREARAANDFAMLQPVLTEMFDRVRDMGAAMSDLTGLSPYDALMDTFEPTMTAARVTELFAPLEDRLPDLVAAVLDKQAAAAPAPVAEGPFAIDAQRAIGVELMGALGFDFDHGRLDISHHPFCGGVVGDVRITTRYDESDFSSAMMGVLHETGHALYEANRPADWLGQPVSVARSMGVHESQSLFVEMQLCRSRAFLTWAAPKIAAGLGRAGDPGLSPDALIASAQRVQRGLIRVDADEVTYPLHVMLRFRLEQALVAGDLDVADLPGAWTEAMESLVGVTPPSDAMGCMQDIHWMDGAVGYFPSYTLGAMLAAQLFEQVDEAIGGVDACVARGDFAPVIGWLRENVHAVGSRYSTDELVRRATGRPLDASAFLAHVERRYLREER